MFWRQGAVAVVLASHFFLTLQATAEELSAKLNVNESVLTQHNDNRRTGAYLAETVLTRSNVEHNFGLLYTLEGEDTPDGKDHIGPIVAQPLFAKGVVIGGQTKDVLYVASRTNKIYAFDVSPAGSHAPLWHIELPKVPQILDLESITAVWRLSDVNKHLDLFATGKDGTVLSNFWDRNDQDWHDWFPIRPDTGKTKPGTPQKITAIWGDPTHAEHLNLFMTDQDGRVKSIFCTLHPDRPCWRDVPWFTVDGPDGGNGQPIATPGQPVTAIWSQDKTQLDLFIAGRDGQVLSNFFENGKWHGWIAIRPDKGRTTPGLPQQITVVPGDLQHPLDLNLFMTVQDGTVKSISRSRQPGHPCSPGDEWLTVGDGASVPIAPPGQPVTAIWNQDTTHLDLFVAARDGQVLSNFFENGKWQKWFPIRPDTGKTKPGTPQEITALWGDPNNQQHLNLFMTDEDGTVRSIFCTIQPNHPCWRDEAWFAVGDGQEEKMVTPGQPISAVWRRDDPIDVSHPDLLFANFSHLDLFVAGKQTTGRYRDFGTTVITPILGQDPVERHGTVLSNFWGKIEENERDWGTWFPVPLRAEAIPGMDDSQSTCLQSHGLVGIVSTPVIDPDTNTMFVVYRTGLPLDLQLGHHAPDNKLYRADAHHWLAAIDIRDGRVLRPPVKIEALNFVPNFVPSMQLNRPALLLEPKTKTIYVAFAAAKCDFGGNPYRPKDSQSHGWVFAYDATNLSQTAFFTTAEGVSGDDSHRIIAGIWQSGNGLASDSQGNVYAFTGNNNEPCGGKQQPNCPPIDYSESIIRWNASVKGAKPVHIRVPEAKELDKGGNDGDLAAGGPVLPFDNLLIGGGKQGVLYSINNPAADPWPQQWPPRPAPPRPVPGEDNRFDRFQAFYHTWPDSDVTDTNDPKNLLKPPPSECNETTASVIRPDYANQANGPNIHGSPVVFRPEGKDYAYIYAMPEKDYIRAFEVRKPSENRSMDHCPAMTTKPVGADGDLRSPKGMPGGFLSISANNGQDGIVWASVSCITNSDGSDCDVATNTSGKVSGRLMAFDALTLKLLWKGDDGPNAVPFAKFVPPTVAAGHVFRVEYKDKIHVYGLNTAGGGLGTASCDQLWLKRNSIYKDVGYCFETPRAIDIFGNVGCKYHNQNDVPLSGSQRQMVDEITRIEAAKYCR